MRSLADDLRHRDDARLAELLRARPDLINPVPPDISALATRAGSATSVARALDTLDRFTLQVAETLAALVEPASGVQVRACFDPDLAAPVDRALHHLVTLALAWGDDPYRLVRTARDAIGSTPGGLGPACVDIRPKLAAVTTQSLQRTLSDAPEKVLQLLDSLLWGPPVGQVERADRVVTVETAVTPVEWLLARDLLVPRGPTTVTLPREVGLALREIRSGIPRVIKDPAWPPRTPVVVAQRSIDEVDRACGHRAVIAVDSITELLHAWSTNAPAVLRSGGLGVRDLAGAARTLDTDEESAAFWLELAYAAGLLARDGQFDEAWRPTTRFDDWLEDTPDMQWSHLARSWLASTRAPEVVRGAAQTEPAPHALSDAVDVMALPALRAEVLALLAEAPLGGALDVDGITDVIADRRPRLNTPTRRAHIRAVVMQAELLGITGYAALGSAGRSVVAGEDAAVIGPIIATSMPQPVEQVMIQGDLTAVAAGPLRGDAARQMRLLADIESTGGATVFRFSEASLRRGFDARRDAADILDALSRLSATPIPQALEYLVHDLGRRHGLLRVGVAASYIRSDDPTHLRTILAADPGIDIVEIAPGVLVSSQPPDRVLSALRDAGLAPIAEAPDGRAINVSSRPQRSPARYAAPPRRATSTPRPALIDAAIATLRATAPSAIPRALDVPHGPAGQTLTTLTSAVAEARTVRLGYVDSDGAQRAMLVTPVRLAAGTLTAMDHTVGQVRSFTVARITGVSPA